MAPDGASKQAKSDAPAEADEQKASEKADDVVLIHGVTDDGEGYRVLRQRNDTLEAGAVVPLREGKPITGDVVRLEPRKESPLLWNVRTELPNPNPPVRRGTGPAQVATDRYRENWDAIWKGKKSAPN